MKFITFTVLLMSWIVPFSSHAENKTNKNVMLVLDASGSMWGKINGTAKINIARTVVKGMLSDWDKNTPLGLIVYGHRRRGDCRDIQTLIPVSTVNPQKFMQTLNTISPKGKTPIGAAVKQAAESLKYTEDSATIILVSDGIETCGMDPCKLGVILKKNGVDFKTHVIGFDIKSQKAIAQLKCLAKNTGGQYFSAKDAPALKKALVKTIKIVKVSKPIVVEPKPVKKVESLEGLKLQATIVSEGKLLEKGVVYSLYFAEKSQAGKRKKINYWNNQGTMIRKLKVGKYFVTAHYGTNGFAEAEVEVKVNKLTTYTFNMNVGTLRVKGIAIDKADPLKKGIVFSLYYPEKDIKGNRKKVNYWNNQGTMIRVLRAGQYFVTARYGVNAYTEATIEIKANQLTDYVFNLSIGSVRLNSIVTDKADPLKKGVVYSIYYANKDLQGNRKKINYWNNQGAMVRVLGAGKYFVTARYGVNGHAEAELEVKANQLTDYVFNLNVGAVRLKGVAITGSEPLKKGIVYSFYYAQKDLTGQRKKINYWNNQGAMVRTLAAGKYFLTAKYGVNASAATEVEVKPNQLAEFVFTLNVGTLKISSAATKESSPYTNGNQFSLYYAKKDIKGNRTKINYWNNQGIMIKLLKAGTYHVVTKRGKLIVETEVTIEANKVSDIKVIVKPL
ncbi:von Willebrand factor type A domain protein [hydrothermal vent metagenome]|uniref:von Willebrand factor type A domain protein n=1 Tax=hydrothermal vent metagenome TaxID=652676 RepID=A0A3B0Y9Y0_9ZZZZ